MEQKPHIKRENDHWILLKSPMAKHLFACLRTKLILKFAINKLASSYSNLETGSNQSCLNPILTLRVSQDEI